MADEDKDAKTEEATPRKLEEARADGQVAMSTEFVAGIMLAATAISIMTVGGGLTEAAGLLGSSSHAAAFVGGRQAA